MAACDPITFNGITQAHFDKIVDEVRQETGMEISGDSGTSSAHGFTVTWNYSPESQDLTLQCTEKPWAVPKTLIQHKFQEIVQENQ